MPLASTRRMLPRLIVSCSLLVLLIVPTAFAGVGGNQSMYVDGTVNSIPRQTKGTLDLSSELAIVFVSEKSKQVWLTIPYERVTRIEYGQATRATPVLPSLLVGKRRKHYLSVFFDDAYGKQQVCVFELAKGIVQPTLKILEARSGKQIQYETEGAKKKDTEAK